MWLVKGNDDLRSLDPGRYIVDTSNPSSQAATRQISVTAISGGSHSRVRPKTSKSPPKTPQTGNCRWRPGETSKNWIRALSQPIPATSFKVPIEKKTVETLGSKEHDVGSSEADAWAATKDTRQRGEFNTGLPLSSSFRRRSGWNQYRWLEL